MNILHINTVSRVGGAARAMYRLHEELKRQGHISQILAGTSATAAPDIFVIGEIIKSRYSLLGRVIDSLGRLADMQLGIPYTRYRSTKHILETDPFQRAQIVHLHNLHGDYFNYHLLPSMSARKGIVWTLHDMWALTGHCAYPYDCERWKRKCRNCPLLKGSKRHLVEPPATRKDRTGQIFRVKRRLYQQTELHIATPSRWLYGLVQESVLAGAASIQCIPNGIDLNVFRPLDRSMARQALEIPLDAKTILCVTQRNPEGRKGFRHLLGALESIEDRESVILLTVGSQKTVGLSLDGFRKRDLGQLSDERLMCLAYNAADIFVFPTLADNLPLMLIEALACGTPSVSFDVGGVSEAVRHNDSGYLARYGDTADLARGITALLGDEHLRERMERRAREIAEDEYSVELQARRYVALYERALQSNPTG